jgi:gamma-glutamyltranspeptidase/glutathione hydrolase
VLEPGKRPRVTLTPTLAMIDGKPFLAFAKQGGDEQDQLLLQFFLNVAEFGMTIQEACEAPSFKTLQMYSSFGEHEKITGGLVLNSSMPEWVRKELTARGYKLSFQERTSGPVNSIGFDHVHGTFWGGSSNYGEDYGIGW